MKQLLILLLLFSCLYSMAQGSYSPAANIPGSDAIYKDSSVFVDWASSCFIKRGLQDIAKENSDTASIGTSQNALGKADGNLVVSLGDGGEAIIEFNGSLFDGLGADFAIFENAFNATFLELAFVEVSSDGINYFRFPAHSQTDTLIPVGSFGSVEATNVNNLAGKYQANYGTPFDLNELAGINGLNIQKVTHIKIIDVVGSLEDLYASRDSARNKINDQYPTPFPSGGFDLDAVGAIHLNPLGLKSIQVQSVNIHPNPFQEVLFVEEKWISASYSISDCKGIELAEGEVMRQAIELGFLEAGIYFLSLRLKNEFGTAKIIKQ